MFTRIIVGLWVAWALSWYAASLWSSPAAKRVGMRREVGYRVVLALGGILLAVPRTGPSARCASGTWATSGR